MTTQTKSIGILGDENGEIYWGAEVEFPTIKDFISGYLAFECIENRNWRDLKDALRVSLDLPEQWTEDYSYRLWNGLEKLSLR